MSHMLKQRSVGAPVAVGDLGIAGRASMSNEEGCDATGYASGAATGGRVGNKTGRTARGDIIGAIVGGAAGAVIGHQMDQQAKEIDASIPGADVERVGEGIQVTFASGLLFAYDSDAILPQAQANLIELANSLKKYPDSQLLIVGHTDNAGTDEYNQGLSQRRAESAARFLETQRSEA